MERWRSIPWVLPDPPKKLFRFFVYSKHGALLAYPISDEITEQSVIVSDGWRWALEDTCSAVLGGVPMPVYKRPTATDFSQIWFSIFVSKVESLPRWALTN